ncbi:UNVERIFIED_CONTAM: hypothetical protein PYX00_003507 [Menopon gallinae]|uniref:UDP-glucuronosyltransferase n=1 Tax=Menopon gallinae TaxID=328185 RepID=A0AAW2I1U6_9NEOP
MIVISFLACVLASSEAARILAVFPAPSVSHQIVYRSYVLELLKRGHNLTVVTTDPIRDPTLKNYREIDVSFYYKRWNSRFQFASDSAKFIRLVPEVFLIAFAETMNEICDMYLSHPEVLKIIRDKEEFDLFVVEFGVSGCFYPFARLSRNNYLGIFSMSQMTVVHSNIGNPATASYLPDALLGQYVPLGFWQRLRATIFQAVQWVVYHRLMTEHTAIARKYFGDDMPSTVVYERNVSAILLNNHFTMTFPRPLVPNVIDIGGPAVHLLRRAPQDLQRFLDSAKEGVIYFSLGSNVKSEAIPESKRRVFIEAFKQLKQKVLWKWEADVLPGKPDNVKIGKWLPQTDILPHPNVKAFITQGGLQSVSEATYNKVPMIVIPFFADQELNARKLVDEGVAIRIDYETLEVDSFLAALRAVLEDKGYKERMVKYSDLTQDQPQSPLDRAVWWTEYVIRHKGARHLRSPAVDMPWYQYFLLDVFAFLLAVLLIFLYIFYIVIRSIKRSLFRGNKVKAD